jgi:anaerobic magnesium-protoporphyrin IX monomethyl ester cyclase
VRYYMMVGNRGETRETFDETLAFLERAKPHQYIFACLSVYPGTRDYDLACEAGWLDPEFYFERDFQELKTTFDASDEDTAFFRDWFQRNKGLHEPWREGVSTSAAPSSSRLPTTPPPTSTSRGALYRGGPARRGGAPRARALDLGYPLPGLALNYLACIAARRGDMEGMKERLAEAVKRDPQHWDISVER